MLAVLGYPKLGDFRNQDGKISFTLYSFGIIVHTFLLLISLVIGMLGSMFLTFIPFIAFLAIFEGLGIWEVPFKGFLFIVTMLLWIILALYFAFRLSNAYDMD